MEKPSLPSGTRDFGVETMQKRKFILSNMERVFQLHGFDAIETPALENLRTLQGKYGDEGDQLLFKVLNSGEYLSKVDPQLLENVDYKVLTPKIVDRGLRYDLTVPLARFVVMNRDKIQFPFKRYQMQPVWRADRPQKGRYREFWQCDIDVVGANSIISEAELVEMYLEVFDALDLKVAVKVNHRGILDAFLPVLGSKENWNSFMVAIDKADKIGQEGVATELENRGLSHAIPHWNWLWTVAQNANNNSLFEALEKYEPIQNDALTLGMSELKQLFSFLGDDRGVQLDLTLARGLSYYTGCVFEVVATDERVPADFRIGSIGGGGRYDNLTGMFGLKDVSGVGVSFGLDRIYDTLEAAGIFPSFENNTTALICAMEDEYLPTATMISRRLRALGIRNEVYPGAAKLKKQLEYANKMNFSYAYIIGRDEFMMRGYQCRNLKSGEQKFRSIDTVIHPDNFDFNE